MLQYMRPQLAQFAPQMVQVAQQVIRLAAAMGLSAGADKFHRWDFCLHSCARNLLTHRSLQGWRMCGQH